ncbi:hypothetical protein KA005_17930 [bacterium]|nr:hypothetical protein [bacterium]
MSKRLRKLLGRADFIYVADCKLASENNLNKITACGEQFVTVMPRTWQENTQFRDKVRQGEITWAHFFSKSNNRKPRSRRDHYYLASGEYTTSNGYRLLWVRSSQKAQQNKDAREQNIKRVFEAIRKI